MLKLFRIALFVVLAAPPAAHAADASISSREVRLGAHRSTAALAAPTTFDMVGLHWRGKGAVRFRTWSAATGWSAWHAAAPEDEDRPDAGVTERTRMGWNVGNPWWARGSSRLEVRTAGRVTRVRAWFVRSSAPRIPLRRVSVAGSPQIVPRRGWSANEKVVRAAPRYAPVLRLAIVHHTAGSNSYRPEESAAIVRGIELYHVRANGWNDIGYNFLVDRYGQVFEGRGGGMLRNVVGAHAEGFNTGSVGIALIGTYSSTAPTRDAEQALASLLAWRLDVGHVDAASSAMIASGGNPKFRTGTGVYLRAISGHRDAGFTACPGNSLYARLSALTETAATTGLPKLYEPALRGTMGKVMRFSARLSAPLPWIVTVTGPDGETVARRTGTGDRISWFWDTARLGSGRYEWTMEAGPDVRPARGVIGGAPVQSPPPRPPLISGLEATPGVISPDGDGYDDVTTIRYTLSERSLVTVTLDDERDAPVATLLTDVRQAPGTKSLSWALDAVPDGRYRVAVFVRGASGRRWRATRDVTIMRSVRSARADPPSFSPDGDGLGDTITFSFTITKAGQVAVEVRQGGWPLGLIFSGRLEPGAYTFDWNGRLGPGSVGPGSYELWVTLSDEIGIVTEAVPFFVTRRGG